MVLEKQQKKTGSLSEEHKEPEDKAAVKQIMCVLTDNKFSPVVYSDEVEFTPHGKSNGPHGALDLLIGIKKTDSHDLQHCIVVKHTDFEDTILTRVNVGETKSFNERLQVVAQPVTQLLAMSHILPLDQPAVLFFANRCFVRPFIYYRSCDMMLTTRYAYEWQDVENRRLIIEGVVMMSLLMQMTNKVLSWLR